jgi:hypothetical protein
LLNVSDISRALYDFSRPLRKANWRVIILCFSTAATFWFFNALNKVYTTRIDYPFELVYNKDSLTLVQSPPNEVGVNVTGGGWQLFKRTISLDSDPVRIDLENPSQTQYFTSTNLLPEFADQLTDLNINYIAADTIFFKIERFADRRLPIRLDSSSIKLRDNYYITSPIYLEPDTVNFRGPISMMKQLPNVFLVSLPENNIDDEYDEELSLDLFSPSLIKKDPEVIHVQFDVEEFSEQNLTVDIEKVNFPFESSVDLEKNQVDLNFNIQRSFRNKVDKSDFMVIADLKYLHAADSTITLEIMDQPDYVRNIVLEDKRVKVSYEE